MTGGGNVAGHKRIFLYGDSIILGSVGASLERVPRFEVTHLSPPQKTT